MSGDKGTSVADAKAVADRIRATHPELAARIDAAVAGAGQSDVVPIKVSISYRLEKFDGDYEPGKQPVEVVEGTDNHQSGASPCR